MNIATFAYLYAAIVTPTGEHVNLVIDDRVRMDICVEIVADYVDADEVYTAGYHGPNGEIIYVDIPPTDLRCSPYVDA